MKVFVAVYSVCVCVTVCVFSGERERATRVAATINNLIFQQSHLTNVAFTVGYIQ